MRVSLAEPLFDLASAIPEARMPVSTTGDKPLKVIDLFAGAGGLSEGFRQQGFEIVAGSDIDPDACATYKRNFPNAITIHGDIREPEIRARVIAAGKGADVVVGGPPCQAFSQVRNATRLIDDPRNSLYREFVSMVDELRPAVFLMENVPGLAQMGVKEQAEEDLSLGGVYRVLPQVLDAADFGVPQTRKRLLFLGIRSDLGVEPAAITGTGATSQLSLARRKKGKYFVDASDGVGEKLLAQLLDPEDLGVTTAAQAISDLRFLQTGRREEDIVVESLRTPESAYQRLMRQSLPDVVQNVSVPRINEDTVLRLKAIPGGGNHRDLPERLLARYLTGQKWGPSTDSGRLGRAHFYAYRRLHPSIWAWTLNTKADSVYHYAFPRALSVREFSRLQSFPDHFTFTTDSRRGTIAGRIDGGQAHSRYRQVGNAVPPLLAAAVAQEVKKLVGKAERRK
ncbi:DNA cytosine methyltransferase [Longispora sp. NPDC051575]|uniref:DNA cytosine methyltransferase n=1 Tax=Longispora sp. NPDC051575 TaxID=3154943 RepID=UPI003440B2AD